MVRFPCPGNHDLPQSLCVAFFQSPYEYLTRSCTATLKPPRAKIRSKPLLPPLHSEAATQKVPDDSLPSIMILYYFEQYVVLSRWNPSLHALVGALFTIRSGRMRGGYRHTEPAFIASASPLYVLDRICFATDSVSLRNSFTTTLQSRLSFFITSASFHSLSSRIVGPIQGFPIPISSLPIHRPRHLSIKS